MSTHDPAILRPLPGILAEIAEAVGDEVALRIALEHGGDDGWDVPRHIDSRAGHALRELVGEQAARIITARFGGDAIPVPLARRAVVQYLYGKGLTTAEVATRLGITRRTARRYRTEKP